jgi:hypothetical protein
VLEEQHNGFVVRVCKVPDLLLFEFTVSCAGKALVAHGYSPTPQLAQECGKILAESGKLVGSSKETHR